MSLCYQWIKSPIKRTITMLKSILVYRLSVPASHGDIHPSARISNAILSLPRKSKISIGANSIFDGRLIFHRPGHFTMGQRSYIGSNTSVHIATSVTIGDDVMISWGCTLIDTNMHSLRFSERKDDVLITGGKVEFSSGGKNWMVVKSGPIHIQDKVWIGLNAIILKGVTLGEGCVVGAGSVVSRNVPPWTLVAGNPAVVIRELEPEIR
jgi:acetyltransferase-like isoleucine patch superfamily enzyme